MYTIGQIADKFDLSISTIRYYDKEGLFPNIKRKNGIRQFDDQDLEVFLVIECLKKSGMQIKEIKQFLLWVDEGNSTLNKRLEMFKNQKQKVLNQIKELESTLNLINYKCWYYGEAVKQGTDENLKTLPVLSMPKEIQNYYKKAHKI